MDSWTEFLEIQGKKTRLFLWEYGKVLLHVAHTMVSQFNKKL